MFCCNVGELSLENVLQHCLNTFPSCLALSVCEHIWLIPDVNMTDVNTDSLPFHSPSIYVGACLFLLPSSIFCLPQYLLLHLYATYPLISPSDVSLPPSLSLSISGVQFCWPRGASFSCGNKRGRPEGGSAHRFWDPAAGGCLCHWNPVCSPSRPLYWARQPGWEVTHWDT